MAKSWQIRKRMPQKAGVSLGIVLFFFVLPLACNGQNTGNNLKSSNKASETNMKSVDQTRQYVRNEIFVKFNSNTNPETIKRIQTEFKLETIQEFRSPNLFLMKITDGATVEATIKKLKTNQAVKYAEPNYVVKANQ